MKCAWLRVDYTPILPLQVHCVVSVPLVGIVWPEIALTNWGWLSVWQIQAVFGNYI